MREVPETHQRGLLSLENLDQVIPFIDTTKQGTVYFIDTDVGLMTSEDGRIWICINGLAFLRFKPGLRKEVTE
jgi:hypothetical protein